MTRQQLFAWLIATVVAAMMCSAYLLDGPDDIATAQAVADDLKSITKATP